MEIVILWSFNNKVYVPDKTEDSNLNEFSMITWINEQKTLTNHISWECKCKLDRTLQITGRITIIVGASLKNIMYLKKDIFGILVHLIVKMENI